ncbi:hypothetical protein OOZ19_27455 [Saccharopolyspora sp. NFXS83]|uniref:hypothetical protein n=1 Tax=Saccharopolyspora sp. NFXS83 TaxID=2993560 RepID=UPI00224A4EB3|nr:hypothetical protein [Saccharopolyspora sp. NFXS83]MCX2733997.1 hypothetical protein [Saccharopolyspora sp. NFXS83]
MRWRVPELALMLGDQAVAQARRVGDRSLRLRAEAVALFASNRLGHGVAVTNRAITAVRDAERAGDHEIAAELRVELACCARTAGGHEVALRVLQPVLERERIEPSLRAHALLELAAALPGKQREAERSEALDEADRLYAAATELNRDTSRLLLARVRTARAGHLRRNGDFEQAARSAEAGLALLDRLGDPAAESGEIRARLVLERVHSLLDLGRRVEAVEAAFPVIRTPVRAAAAGPSGWLRLALATRVHLPSGELAAAVRLLNDAAANAERHKLDCLLAESLSMSSQTHERAEEYVEALAMLRRAYAADRRWRAAVHSARVRLLEEFPALATASPAARGTAGRTAEPAEPIAPAAAEAGSRQAAEAVAEPAPERPRRSRAAADPVVEASAHDSDGAHGADVPAPRQTAGRRRADGTGRPQRLADPEPQAPIVPAPLPETSWPEPEPAPEAQALIAQQPSSGDPLDEYRKPGESSVRDAARRLMDTLTSRVADDRRPHPDTPGQDRPASAPETSGTAMPEPRAPEQDPTAPPAATAGSGGKRRAPEPEPPAADEPGRHGGVDVPVGRVTAAPFSEGFPVFDFGSGGASDRGAESSAEDFPDFRTRGARREEPAVDEPSPSPSEMGAPWDRSPATEPVAPPDVTAIMPVISIPDDEPPAPSGQVGAVEHLDDSAVPRGPERWPADPGPATPESFGAATSGSYEEGGRRSRGRSLAEIRESLAEMQRHGREDTGQDAPRRAAPERADSDPLGDRGDEPPRSGASWADRYLGAYLDGDPQEAAPEPRSGGRRRARHADPDEQPATPAIPETPRWEPEPESSYRDSPQWGGSATRSTGAPDPLGPSGTTDSGLPPNLGALSEPPHAEPYYTGTSYAESVFADPGEDVSPFDRTRPEFGPAHSAGLDSAGSALADPGRPAAERLESAAELLARHRDGGTEQSSDDEPGNEVGLADLLAEALLAYENGRRGQDDTDGAGRHGQPTANGHPVGLPHPNDAEPEDPGTPRHRRPASHHEPWTSWGH